MRESPRLLIIGVLDNRRVRGFVEAVEARGLPTPLVLGHRDLLADPSALAAIPDQPLVVRIESAGEDPELTRALLARGAEALPNDATCERVDPTEAPRFGEIVAPRQLHAGFLDYLDDLDAVLAARPSWRVLNPIADIRALFDKRETSRRYASLGVPVPDAIDEAIASPDELRAAMVARRWPAVYVKLSCSSSASCLAIYRHLPRRPPDQRDLIITTVAATPDGRFNSLRLQRLMTRDRVDALLQWLIDEGVQIERAIPKARLGGRVFDLRVVVIAGVPSFCVVRQSRHPITNLHLGGQRGDLAALREAMSGEAWAAAMASCATVFAAHGCHHLGVDVLIEPDLRGHRIIEANAFGDLLPRLERAGRSVYGWELEALLGSSPPSLVDSVN